MRAQIGEVVKAIYPPEIHPVSYTKKLELLSLLQGEIPSNQFKTKDRWYKLYL
jgi:hypothetical protein